MLLSLKIKTTNVSFADEHWQSIDYESCVFGDKAKEHFAPSLPVISEQKQFNFDPNVEVFWEHHLNAGLVGKVPTILFVRDPRDAIYSLYRRHYEKQISFKKFLKRPDEWPDHFPNLFGLPPFETFALFCFFWIKLSHSLPLSIIRFEDLKLKPEPELRKALAFLGLEKSDNDIETAIKSSTTENAMKSQQANPTKFLEIRKGAVSEWKTSYRRGHVGAISKLGWQICEELGYETPSSQGKFFELPINDLLARNFSLKQVKSIENWLSSECWDLDTRREMVVNLAVTENFKNITLMKLLLLERSMFFAYELSRNQNKEFQSALFDTFANLLLRFSKEKPVQQLALRSLKHVEDDLNFHGRLTLPWKLKLEHRLKNSVTLGKIYSRARIFLGVEGE